MDVAHSPPAKKKPAGPSKWSLDPGLEVSLRLTAASTTTGDLKVRVELWAGRVGGDKQVTAG